jgi:putative transcriptional regulator
LASLLASRPEDERGTFRRSKSRYDRADDDAGEAPMNNKLKVLRAMRNWSQAELADRLDVSRQAVNAIETGKYDPSLPLAFKLARLFDMKIEEIFDDGTEGNGDA